MKIEPTAAQMKNMELLTAMEEIVAAYLKEMREEMRADHEEMMAKLDSDREEMRAIFRVDRGETKAYPEKMEANPEEMESRGPQGTCHSGNGQSGTGTVQVTRLPL
jgi:hypothetical protein